MHVGSLRARLLLRQSQSLKDKRQVVRSVLERLRNALKAHPVAEFVAAESEVLSPMF